MPTPQEFQAQYDAAVASRVTADAIRAQAAAALDVNRTYIARANPTAAQTAAQTKSLSRQNVGVIRLLLNLLDGTD